MTVIAQQDFDALTGAKRNDDAFSPGTVRGELTNTASFSTAGPGLGFATFWTDTRGQAGPAAGDDVDWFGVNGQTGWLAPELAADGTAVGASQKNFRFNDGDGLMELILAPMDLTGYAGRTLTLDTWIAPTGWEAGDAFSVALTDGTTTVELYALDAARLAAGAAADDGTAKWTPLSFDIEGALAGLDASKVQVVIAADTDAPAERIFVDDIAVSGTSAPAPAPAFASFAVTASPMATINEFVFNHTGSDDSEYVEIFAAPGTDLSGLTLLAIEGDAGAPTGQIDSVRNVGTTDANGLWVTPLLANEYENGTVSLLLVEGFTGAAGDDIDADDDGVIDSPPWTSIVDAVAVTDGGAGDLTYALPVLSPGFDGVSFTPGGASRIPDGTDTDTAADWVRNDFGLAGLPGVTGSPEAGEALNTPGAPNAAVSAVPQIVVTEILQNPAAVFDSDGEWFEVFNAGTAPVDLQGWTISDNDSDSHTISTSVVVQPGAYAVLGRNPNTATNGGVALDYAYTGFILANGADEIVLSDGTSEIDRVEYDGGPAFPDPTGASMELIDVALDNNVGANWQTAQTAFGDGDLGTPGAENGGGTPPGDPAELVITEIMQNPSAVSDSAGEYVEIFNAGTEAVDLQGYRIEDDGIDSHTFTASLVVAPGAYVVLGINADAGTNGGVPIDYQYDNFFLANGDDEVVLIDDADREIDRVAYDGGPLFPDPTGASMELIDVALDNNVGANWETAEDAFGAGDLGTPGAANAGPPPAPSVVLNEIRIDQSGADDDEFFELFGDPATSLDGLSYLVIGDGAGGSGVIEHVTDLTGFAIDSNGFFVGAEATFGGSADAVFPLNFENGDNVTHLLVRDFTGADGDDLDSDDDGVLDSTPWAAALDSVALIEDPAGGEQTYGLADIGPDGSFVPAHVFRMPDGTGPWQIGDFGDLSSDTPGAPNDGSAIGVDLQISEIWPGNAPGTDLSGDWFEIVNAGDAPWIAGEDSALFYDDDSRDPLAAAQIEGLSEILPGERAVVLVTGEDDTAERAEFVDLWDDVFDLAAVEVGVAFGPDLGTSGDAVTLFSATLVPAPGTFPTPTDFVELDFETVPDTTGNGGRSWDVELGAFSQDGVAGARATVLLNDQGQPAIGSPGDAAPVLPVTKIHEVQGAGAVSPLVGQVVTVVGIVTADLQDPDVSDYGGIFLQEEDGDTDADPLTSEGIFVSNLPLDVAAGEQVEVTGEVVEVDGETRIVAQSAAVVASSPTETVTPASVAFPIATTTTNSDGHIIADLEAYEGMLVTVPEEMTVGDLFTLGRYGEVGLTSGGRIQNFTQVNAPDAVAYAQFQQDVAKRGLVIDDFFEGAQNRDPVFPQGGGLDAQAPNILRAGDTVTGLEGVVSYREPPFDAFNYRLLPTDTPQFVPENPRPDTPPEVGGTLKVAAFNVLNYFTTIDDGTAQTGPAGDQGPRGADDNGTDPLGRSEFERQEAKLVAALSALEADVIGLTEIENDPLGSTSLLAITAALSTATGATWSFVDAGPIEGAQGGALEGDAIKVGFLYNEDTVDLNGDFAILDETVDPRFQTIETQRPALAQTFTEEASGESFTAVVNHFKSKGSIVDGDAAIGDGQGNNATVRADAADALVDWLAADPTGTGEEDVLILGDLNAYLQEDAIQQILDGADDTRGTGDDYVSLVGPDDYSYGFPVGLDTVPQVQTFGTLDYAIASGSMNGQVTGAGIWHVNADEAAALDYNLDFKSAAQQVSLYAEDPFRSSDHDPVIVGLDLSSPLQIVSGGPGFDRLRGDAGDQSFIVEGTDFVTTGGGEDRVDLLTVLSNDRRDVIYVTDFDTAQDALAGLTRDDVFREIETPSRSILILDSFDIVTLVGVSETDDIQYAPASVV